ncbi:hypothetical protein [Kitasatospora sp. NPDC093558]|uniref:hypothetical protein n=1 Tax=Kitasatospora sp. NPDC093558 TaxID=3155201 RepID=UPI003446AC67
MNRLTGSDGQHALAILGPPATRLLQELDHTFTTWAKDAGADQIAPPPLYPVTDLEKFDVYTNFPHLAWTAAPLDLTGDKAGQHKPSGGRFTPDALADARYGLPHATCYGAYLYLEDTTLPGDTLLTLVNRCFRHEDHYEGLRRLASFQMREIVAIGSYDHTQQVLHHFTERILAFARALGLDLGKAPAGDPFFQNDGARALLQKLNPVKHEFQYGDLAIASVNTHRNFFGERCNITLATGEHAYTSCTAFGLERWIAVLTEYFGGDLDEAAEAVRSAGAADGAGPS